MNIAGELTAVLASARWLIQRFGLSTGAERDSDGRLSMIGAIKQSAGVADALLLLAILDRRGSGEAWSKAATKSQIVDSLGYITNGDLERTFGPRWYDIVDIVRSAAVGSERYMTSMYDAMRRASGQLSPDQRAFVSRHPVDQPQLRASMDAAILASASTRPPEDHDHDWHATIARAYGWAAWATAYQDQLGEGGYTQELHDTLSLPWRDSYAPIPNSR